MKRLILKIILYTMIIIILIMAIFPFIWLLGTSFKSTDETFIMPPQILPKHFLLDNYIVVFERLDVIRMFFNSLIYSLGSVIIYLIIISCAGYALAKYEFPGRQLIFICILATMMIPIEVLLVPLFKLLVNLNWLNTYHGMILPRVVEPFGIFLLKQHFTTIPNDFIDAARIDGSSEFSTFRKIMLPLSKPILAVAGIFMFTWRWNELLWPLVVGNRQEMHTLQIGVAMFIKEWYIEWNYLFALCVLAIIPILVLFVFLQPYFVKGVVMTGIKG